MDRLFEIDNVLLYSYQSDDINIIEKINLDENKIKIMRNNFSRFWNIITKEQRKQYIILSLQDSKNILKP